MKGKSDSTWILLIIWFIVMTLLFVQNFIILFLQVLGAAIIIGVCIFGYYHYIKRHVEDQRQLKVGEKKRRRKNVK